MSGGAPGFQRWKPPRGSRSPTAQGAAPGGSPAPWGPPDGPAPLPGAGTGQGGTSTPLVPQDPAPTLTRKLPSFSCVTITAESWSFSSKCTWPWAPSGGWLGAKRTPPPFALLPARRGQSLASLPAPREAPPPSPASCPPTAPEDGPRLEYRWTGRGFPSFPPSHSRNAPCHGLARGHMDTGDQWPQGAHPPSRGGAWTSPQTMPRSQGSHPSPGLGSICSLP